MTKVTVHDNNVDRALRKFKKKVNDNGLLKDLQECQAYVKPSVRKKIAKQQAKKRWNKYLRDQSLPKKEF